MPNRFDMTVLDRPGRSRFDLSYKHLFDCDMGQLIPVQCDVAIPSDVWNMSNSIVVRAQPLVAPIMHKIDVHYDTFFVPFRYLDPDNFGEFRTGGVDGDDEYVLPKWTPTSYGVGSLWDHLGQPAGVIPAGHLPIKYILWAYNRIYNWHYRDQNNIDPVDDDHENIKRCSWSKDYFTASLLTQQRGTAPALPVTITGTASADFTTAVGAQVNTQAVYLNNSNSTLHAQTYNTQLLAALNKNTIDGASFSAATFDMTDMRLTASLQLYQELLARSGVRLPEFYKAVFGVNMGDDSIQEPILIGSTKYPLTINEVLQTGETGTTPQGHMAGHGITRRAGHVTNFRVPEDGLIMSIMYLRPEAIYSQGVNRQFNFDTRYELYNPLFAGLSEQAVLTGELYATAVEAENDAVFGYIGNQDHHRVKMNQVSGKMQSDYDHWHLSRQFSSAPTLGATFLECNPRKDVFAAPSEPGFIVDCGNVIVCDRPLPAIARPGIYRM